jgi:hypothetical protein
MFINCPHCHALVATDPATDLPPPRCPRCAVVLREAASPPASETVETRHEQAEDATPATDPLVEAVAAAASPATAAEGGTTEALTQAPIPLAPDIVAAAPIAKQESERQASSDSAEHSGSLGTAPGYGLGTEPQDDEAARIPGPEAAHAPADAGDTADAALAQGADSATPLPTEPLTIADPAAGAEVPNAAEPDVPAMPSPPHLSAVEDAGKPEPEAGAGSAPEADATMAGAASEPEPDPGLDAARDPNPAPAPGPIPAAGSASGKAAPNFARARAPTAAANGQRRWLLPSLIAALSLLLGLQWVLADREQLAADARWRPLIVQLCGVLRCSLPPWREPGAFALLDRDVRPHPTVPGALRVSATFRNDARWAQRWPDVVLTLSDVEGHAVGARAFAASEYLGTAPTQNELASGQTATIRMDVLEPAPRVVAFAFDFR